MSYEEPETFSIWGLSVQCSPSVQFSILRRWKSTPEFRRWHALDTRVKQIHVCAEGMEAWRQQLEESRRVAEELADAEIAASERLAVLIEVETAAAD